MKDRGILVSSAAAIAALTMGTAAQAQGAGDARPVPLTEAGQDDSGANDIIVTANKRAENLQDVPITISAVSEQTLENATVNNLQDLTSLVSGYVGPGNIPTLSIHLRGIGGQINGPNTEASVATYIDGVYIGATSPAAYALNDVSQIEVLKGPQGTLFGRNTTGGVINVKTRDPDPDGILGEVELQYGSYETLRTSGYANVPLGGDSAANLSVLRTSMGKGWGTNLATGVPKGKINEEWTIRGKIDLAIGPDTSLMLMGDYEYHDDVNFFQGRHREGNLAVDGTIAVPGAPPAGPGLPPTPPVPGTYRVGDLGWDSNTFRDVFTNSEAYGLSARFTHDFGSVTLTDILAYRRTSFDLDGFTGNLSPRPEAADITVIWYTLNKQFTNELQLSSNGNTAFKWTAGLFYYSADDDSDQTIVGGPLGPPFTIFNVGTKKTKSYAAFAQASYELSPATTLTAGGRYSHEDVSIVATVLHTAPFAFLDEFPDQDFKRGSYSARVSLAHKFSDTAMVYASYNRGTKPGTYQLVTPSDPDIKDEKLDAFELGTKLELADRAVRLNITGFYYSYKNVQLNSFFFPGPPRQFNGPGSDLYGVDVDLSVHPAEGLTIDANMEWMKSEFRSYPNAEIFVQNETVTPGVPGAFVSIGDATGNDLPFAPEFTANLAVNYEIPTSNAGTFNLNSTLSYNSGFYGSPGNEALNEQGAYARVAASVRWTDPSDTFYVMAWGRNLTKTKSAVQLNYTSAGPTLQLDAPRTFGVTVGAKFK